MSRVVVSEGYRSVLSLYDTQEAIALIKKTFEKSLSNALNLKRVSRHRCSWTGASRTERRPERRGAPRQL